MGALNPREGYKTGMIEKNRNPAAEALRADKKISCAWLQAASPITAEIFADARAKYDRGYKI
jgi:2-keto-3-deoxy-L-rhamnonate aldolase RhmA